MRALSALKLKAGSPTASASPRETLRSEPPARSSPYVDPIDVCACSSRTGRGPGTPGSPACEHRCTASEHCVRSQSNCSLDDDVQEQESPLPTLDKDGRGSRSSSPTHPPKIRALLVELLVAIEVLGQQASSPGTNESPLPPTSHRQEPERSSQARRTTPTGSCSDQLLGASGASRLFAPASRPEPRSARRAAEDADESPPRSSAYRCRDRIDEAEFSPTTTAHRRHQTDQWPPPSWAGNAGTFDPTPDSSSLPASASCPTPRSS